MRISFVILFLLLSRALFASDAPSKYALFVGNNDYASQEHAKLRYAENDAKDLAALFKGAGFTTELLLGKSATKEAILRHLKKLRESAGPDGVIVVGFSGSGIESKNGPSFLPYDMAMKDGKNIDPSSGVPLDEVASLLNGSSKGNRLIVFDACRLEIDSASNRNVIFENFSKRIPKKTAILAACGAGELSFEIPSLGHGALSDSLLAELKDFASIEECPVLRLADRIRPQMQKYVSDFTNGQRSQKMELIGDETVYLKPLVGVSKYALFVAVSKYHHAEMNRPLLEYPEIDAKALAEIFRQSGYSVDVLLGTQATRDAIANKLSQLKRMGDSDGSVVVGLFGHGIEFDSTRIACFCPYDTSLRNKVDSQGKRVLDDNGVPRVEPDPDSLISMDDLLATFRLSPAGNKTLLADCCRNDPNKARGRAFGANLRVTDLPHNMAALFACSEDEQALEHQDWGHGAFTKCLIDEIRQMSNQGPVTAGALSDHLRQRVSQLVKKTTEGRKGQTTRSLIYDTVDLQLLPTK